MKKFFLLAVTIAFTNTLWASEMSASASCLDSVSNSQLLNEVSDRMGNGSPGDGIQVTQEVSLVCLQSSKDNYSYTPNETRLLEWANDCRTEVNTRKCTEISATPNVACFDKLIEFYPYTPNNRTISEFQRACRSKTFVCSYSI